MREPQPRITGLDHLIFKQPADRRAMRMALLLCLIVASGAACRRAGGGGEPQQGGLPTDLARKAEIRPATGVPGGDATSGSGAGEGASKSPVPTGPDAVGYEQRELVTFDDVEGDAGVQAPAYADLVSVRIADEGPNARISLTFSGPLPVRLEDAEVQGVGVDLFTSSTSSNSQYQVFMDGGPEGWFAYLEGPNGFVGFPGSFTLAGKTLSIELPWGAIGNKQAKWVSVFVDRSDATLAVPVEGSDHSPDQGVVRFIE